VLGYCQKMALILNSLSATFQPRAPLCVHAGSLVAVGICTSTLKLFHPRTMSSEIKAIFEKACAGLVVDAALAARIHQYVVNFINKNPDHSEFFGGNLLGVQVVRFTEADKNRWFDDILDANEFTIREQIAKLSVVRGADDNVFNVAGDPMNQSCAWLVHRFFNAPGMKFEQKQAAMMDVLLVLQIKFITSRLYRLFRYPADRAVAEATYAALSNKFLIKTEGTWLKVLKFRSTDIISPTSLHFNTISQMQSDERVVYMVNDIQGRIRDMLKNIYGVFLNVHNSGNKISSSSSTVEFDGVEILKERTKGLEGYTRYLKSVIADKNSFIRPELLKVIQKVMETAPEKHIKAALEYLSANYLKTANDEVTKLINQTLIHSFGYFAANRANINANVDLAVLLTRLRGVYTSSRSKDPDLLELRTLAEKQVRKAIDTKTDSVVASVRTAVLLYLVARACTMRHYTNASTVETV